MAPSRVRLELHLNLQDPPLNAFDAVATDGAAAPVLENSAWRGPQAKAFMPVGTKASVKVVHPDELRRVGCLTCPREHVPPPLQTRRGRHREPPRPPRILGLGRPDPHRLRRLPGLLVRDTIVVDERACPSVRSTMARVRSLGTRVAAEIRPRLGSDMAMCLDVCLPARPRVVIQRALRLTTTGPMPARGPTGSGQLLFGITQGGTDPSSEPLDRGEVSWFSFDGVALGGLKVGESRGEMLYTVSWAAPRSCGPAALLHGYRRLTGILEVIERGIDIFDYVLPTRTGRTGTALTPDGRLNLRNARYARDPRPLQDGAPALLACVSHARISATSSTRASSSDCACHPPYSGSSSTCARARSAQSSVGPWHTSSGKTLERLARDSEEDPCCSTLIFIVLILLSSWLLFIRPQRRKQQAQQDDAQQRRSGDEVLTAGGLYGTVRAVQDDELSVEIAPGSRCTVAARHRGGSPARGRGARRGRGGLRDR